MSDASLLQTQIEPATGPGVVWAFDFAESGVGRPVDVPALERGGRGGFHWAHLDLVHGGTRSWLNAQEARLGAAVDTLLSQDAHPHVDWSGDLVWGVVRDMGREVDKADDQAAELRFVLGPDFVLTGRRRPTQAAHAVKRKVETGEAYPSSVDLFEELLTEIAEAIGRVANRAVEHLDKVEDRVLSSDHHDDRATLLTLRREVTRFTRLAAALRAVVGRLEQTHGVPHHCQGLTTRLGQRVASLHADISYISEHARLLNDEVVAQVAARANKHLFTLTVLTTLLLPPSLVTGYFGMNTKNLPFTDIEYGSLFATAIMAAAALLAYLVIRANGIVGRRRA